MGCGPEGPAYPPGDPEQKLDQNHGANDGRHGCELHRSAEADWKVGRRQPGLLGAMARASPSARRASGPGTFPHPAGKVPAGGAWLLWLAKFQRTTGGAGERKGPASVGAPIVSRAGSAERRDGVGDGICIYVFYFDAGTMAWWPDLENESEPERLLQGTQLGCAPLVPGAPSDPQWAPKCGVYQPQSTLLCGRRTTTAK